MKTIKQIFVIITLFNCLQPSMLKSQTNWTNYSGNPIIDSDFDPESLVIHRPSVLFDGDSYHMWYASIRVFIIGIDVQVHLNSMGYATSPDGVSWQSVNPVVIEPSFAGDAFDQFHAGQGWVIADNDTFKMWYWGYNPNYGGKRLNSIGYAWSLDGSNWTRVAGSGALGSVYDLDMAGLPDNVGLATPCVVKTGGTYHMWHSQDVHDSMLSSIGYARSSDGIHWTKVNGSGQNGSVIDVGPPGRFDELTASWPAVIKTDEGFMMWYYGFNGTTPQIGCSISTDGINWSTAPGVEASGACFGGAMGTCVIPMETQYKMWYAQGDSNTVKLAFSDYDTDVRVSDNTDCPQTFTLEQNFPNPFNPSTKIEYIVKAPCLVNLVVYNLTGQVVKEFVNSYQQPGIHSITLNMQGFPSGIYFYKIRMSDFQAVKEMVKIE